MICIINDYLESLQEEFLALNAYLLEDWIFAQLEAFWSLKIYSS